MSSMHSQPIPPAPPISPAPPPRRLSVFGGLLWIIVGSLLLINNLVTDLRLWELFARYWPVLLILLGLAKLADHFSRLQTGAPPARLMTGGEIFLLILLLLIGGGLTLGNRIRANPDFDFFPPWENEHTFPEEASLAAPTTQPVRVDLNRGNVTILAEETDQIRAVVHKRVRGSSEADARERSQDSGIEVVESGGVYVVRPRAGSDRSIIFDLELSVPRRVPVDVRVGNGDVRIQDTQADVKVQADDVEIRGVKGAVEAKVDGDVLIVGAASDVRVDGDCRGIEIADVTGGATIRCGFTGRATLRNIGKQVYFKSVRTEFTAGSLPGRMVIGSGDLELYDAPKDVTLVTRNYDILMENVAGRIRVENRNGNVQVRMPKAPTDEISVANERGSVELMLPATSAFEITASSNRGRVESDFAGLNMDSRDRERRMEGKIGSGGPRINLRTTYDDVYLRKGQ